MIIDCNTHLGHWPFRRLRHNTARGLLKLMDEKGIDRAVVSSLSAIFYNNCHSGNEELHDDLKRHRDRLIPLAVINPRYAGWRDDLRQCREDFDMKGVLVHPPYHGYAVREEVLTALIELATELKMFVAFSFRMVDPRQRHWLIDVPDLAVSEVAARVGQHPQTKFLLLNGLGLVNSEFTREPLVKARNFWLDISRMSAVLQKEIPQLLDRLGPSRLVFGTQMPLKYPDPVLLKMKVLDAPGRVKKKIWGENAEKLLGD